VYRVDGVRGAKPFSDDVESLVVQVVFDNLVRLNIVAHEESFSFFGCNVGATIVRNDVVCGVVSNQTGVQADSLDDESLANGEVIVMSSQVLGGGSVVGIETDVNEV